MAKIHNLKLLSQERKIFKNAAEFQNFKITQLK